jgi:penicillin amidase
MEPIELKHARRKFQAHRDAAGVPHVEAPSRLEAVYGLGYLHALDRPTQMLFSRTIAAGTASARISTSPDLCDTDRFFRRIGLYRNIERELDGMDDAVFDQLTAYCEGVNDGMKQSGRSLPMWASGFRPQPWNQQASMLIGNLLSFGGLAIGQQQNERLLVEFIQMGLNEEQMGDLFGPIIAEADFDLLRDVHIPHHLSDEALELIADLPRVAGSNAWVVSPERSASGHAMLASDPHLEINRLPAIWYEACLRWGDDYVMGATLPGTPIFAVARNNRLAWGVTYMKGDTSDYFVEDCRRGGETGWQYRRGGEWRDFDLREEVIEHKGGEPEVLRVYENAQGILDGDPDADGEGKYLLMSWVGSLDNRGRSMAAWLDVAASENARQAMDAVRDCPHPTLVWVFADREGHIGMQASGKFPLRPKGQSGLVPVPAWDESNHWQGFLHDDQLPRAYDPPEGYIASANENLNPPGGPQFITLNVPEYRKRRLVELLDELPAATLEDMQRLQYDVVSLQARDLLQVFLPHMQGPLRDQLAAWDCSYSPDSVEPSLFQQLYRNVLLEVFGHAKGIGWRRMMYFSTRFGYATAVLTGIDRLLGRDESVWWRGRDKGALIHAAADRLLLEQPEPWGVRNSFHFVNRYFEGRLGGRFLGFHTKAVPMPGCHASPFQGHLLRTATRETTFAPSYHFVADLETDQAWTNLPGGPSESRFSKWYTTDIARWAAGEYKMLSWEG